MTVMSAQLKQQLDTILDQTFTVKEVGKCDVEFENNLSIQDSYALCIKNLSEYEIIEVAKILVDVYRIPAVTENLSDWGSKALTVNLNSFTEKSRDLVKAILALDSSSFHKLLLLTSGNFFLVMFDTDVIITLAKAKAEFYKDAEIFLTRRYQKKDLKTYYILPGVSAVTLLPEKDNLDVNRVMDSSVELTSTLLAFLTDTDSSKTFNEYLELDLETAITTSRVVNNFSIVNASLRFLESETYSDFAKTLTAREIHALVHIIPKGKTDKSFPKEILKNRCNAMASRRVVTNDFNTAFALPNRFSIISVSAFLSDGEQNSCSKEYYRKIDSTLLNKFNQISSAAVIFAAVAEVGAVKGWDRALEVSLTLQTIPGLRTSDPNFIESAVYLVSEALDPFNDGVPFGWVSQMSEQSWLVEPQSPEILALGLM